MFLLHSEIFIFILIVSIASANFDQLYTFGLGHFVFGLPFKFIINNSLNKWKFLSSLHLF